MLVIDINIFLVVSNGVERTGILISIHSQLERLKTEGVVDVFQFIKCARVQRAHLVPQCVSLLASER